MAKRKHVKVNPAPGRKHVILPKQTHIQTADCPIFLFDMIDRNGPFAFTPEADKFDCKSVFVKIIEYSRMTWNEIMSQTHDKTNKSKHHYLKDIGRLSNQAKERLRKMKIDDMTECLFSFAFTNKLRIIGLRMGNGFHVLWYDPDHKVYPSKK